MITKGYLEKFEQFHLTRYRIILQPKDFIKFHRFAGSSLGKDFSPVFKQITCLAPENECDKGCEQRVECPYFITLMDGTPPVSKQLKQFQTPPKPFIFEPPLRGKSLFSHHELLHFDLILFGKAVDYLPFFIASLNRIGELGVGLNRGKFSLKTITAMDMLNDSILYEYRIGESEPVQKKDAVFTLSQLLQKYDREKEEVHEIDVSIVTPLRMKGLGNENWHLRFRTLLKNILTRVSNLAYAYCGFEKFLFFPDLLYQAEAIRTVEENFVWADLRSSYMRKNKPDSRLGGYCGRIRYQGDLTQFWPYLRLGEILHIGKNTSFGLGKMEVSMKNGASEIKNL